MYISENTWQTPNTEGINQSDLNQVCIAPSTTSQERTVASLYQQGQLTEKTWSVIWSTNLAAGKPVTTYRCRAPNDAQFAHLWCTRTDFHPLQVCTMCGVDPLNLLVRGVFTPYSFVLCVSLNKFEFLPYLTRHLCPCSRKQTSIIIFFFSFFFFLLFFRQL